MAHRIDKRFLQAKLARFAKMTGLTISTGYVLKGDKRVAPVGHIFLEKAPFGAKWRVVQYVNEGGGERHLSGWSNDMTAGELVAWFEGVEFALGELPRMNKVWGFHLKNTEKQTNG